MIQRFSRSLLLLGLCSLPSLAFAEAADPSPSPSPSASPPPPSAAVSSTREVGLAEFEKLGLGLSFNAESLQVSGVLSRVCGEHLSIKDIKRSDAEKPDAALENESDLALHSSKVAIRVVYDGGGTYKDLSDCEEKNKDNGDRLDLQLRPELSRNIVKKDEVALAGLLNEKNEFSSLHSPATTLSYRRIKDQLSVKDCTNCNSDSRSVKTRLDQLAQLDLPWVQPLMKSLLDSALAQTENSIKNAKSLRDLESLLKDLSDYADTADHLRLENSEKSRIMDSIASQMDLLIAKNEELAHESVTACASREVKSTRTFYSNSGSCAAVGTHADFISKVYAQVSQLPGLDSDSRAEARKKSRDYANHGLARVDFISSVDPANSEVRAVLNGGTETLRNLNKQVNKSCMFIFNERQFTQCNQARANYNTAMNQLNIYAQRFMTAQRMNQNPMPMMNGNNYYNSSPYGYGVNGMYPMNAAAVPMNGQMPMYGMNTYNPYGR